MPLVLVGMSSDIPKPGRPLLKDPLKKSLKHECADQDPTVRQAAEMSLDLIKAQPGGEHHIQHALVSHIAQAVRGGTASANITHLKEP